MKKIIAIIAIVLCFSVFAVSCANKQGETDQTSTGTNGDGVIDWNDFDKTTGDTQEGETTAATTLERHPQSWENGGVDTDERWGPLKTGYN